MLVMDYYASANSKPVSFALVFCKLVDIFWSPDTSHLQANTRALFNLQSKKGKMSEQLKFCHNLVKEFFSKKHSVSGSAFWNLMQYSSFFVVVLFHTDNSAVWVVKQASISDNGEKTWLHHHVFIS